MVSPYRGDYVSQEHEDGGGALTLLFAEYSEAAKDALKEMLKDD